MLNFPIRDADQIMRQTKNCLLCLFKVLENKVKTISELSIIIIYITEAGIEGFGLAFCLFSLIALTNT